AEAFAAGPRQTGVDAKHDAADDHQAANRADAASADKLGRAGQRFGRAHRKAVAVEIARLDDRKLFLGKLNRAIDVVISLGAANPSGFCAMLDRHAHAPPYCAATDTRM